MSELITKIQEEIGIMVYSNPGESFEAMLHRFDQKVKKSRILSEYKNKQVYKKPSVIKREKFFKSILKNKKRDFLDGK